MYLIVFRVCISFITMPWKDRHLIFILPLTEVIENVKKFKYLGIVLSKTGSFTETKKHLCEEAQ